MKPRIWAFFLLLIGLVVTAIVGRQAWFTETCRLTPRFYPTGESAESVERSLITGEPCVPPCWQGITPGVSTEEDVIAVLEQAPFVDTISIQQYSRNGEIQSITWIGTIGNWNAQINTIQFRSDARVSTIEVRLEYELGIQELIHIYGEPDYYFAARMAPDTPCFSVRIIWLQDGLAASLDRLPQGRVARPTTRVERVVYTTPAENILEFLGSLTLGGPTEVTEALANVYQPWNGLEEITLD
jgi:hypothetical protein